MEREPEEDNDCQHCKQSIHTLLDFLSHRSFFFRRIIDYFFCSLLTRSRENITVDDEDKQRNQHRQYRSDERIVDTCIEYIQILCTERSHIGRHRTTYLDDQFRHVVEAVGSHTRTFLKILMAQRRKVSIISQVMNLQPPFPQQRSDERRNQTTDIDEYIKYLETGVTTASGNLQSFRALFCGFFLEIVIHLTDNRLQITFEQTVTESNQEQGKTCQRKQPTDVGFCRQYRNRKDNVSQRHHYQSGHDSSLIVLCFVGDDTPNQAQYIDTAIKYRIDNGAGFIAQTEFGAEEQYQHGIHDVIAKTFAHVRYCCSQQTFWMIFKHK